METGKNIKRLNRRELLEMLVIQSRRVEQLEQEVAELKQRLEDKQLSIRDCGSIAQASLQISGIFDAAQAAADQYLENIARMEREMSELHGQAMREAEGCGEEKPLDPQALPVIDPPAEPE